MDDLYREQILDHYKRPHNWGELDDADYEFEDNNPLCGDVLKVQLKVDDQGTVECPRHGSEFDLKTGKPITLPAYVPVETFPVLVEGDQIKVEVE